MLSKIMANPDATAIFLKAQQNPKMMAAIKDVQANGPDAVAKYRDEPEIMATIHQLQALFAAEKKAPAAEHGHAEHGSTPWTPSTATPSTATSTTATATTATARTATPTSTGTGD